LIAIAQNATSGINNMGPVIIGFTPGHLANLPADPRQIWR
jgi:hypothetical protein